MTTASEQVVIPQSEVPASAVVAPAAPIPTEIAYLQQNGMNAEATSLQAELEGLLKSREQPVVAPVAPAPTPAPPPPAPVEAAPDPAARTPEQTFDPYAVDGAEHETVLIDSEGRTRDAKTGRYVPVQALHAARTKVSDLRTELQVVKEENARAQERLVILNEILAADDTPKAPAVVPEVVAPVVEDFLDPEVDIFKSAKQMQEIIKQYDAKVKMLEEKISGTDKVSRQQFEQLAMENAVANDVRSFNARNSDFMAAYNHLRKVRDASLQTLGYTDQAARDTALANEERSLAMNAVKNKKSYAELVYKLAKDYGYTQPAPTPPPPSPAPAAPAAAPVAPAVDPTAAARVQALAQAKETASPSLNGVGGSGGEGLTVSQLANMSHDDFLNLAAKLGGKAKMDEFLRRG